MTDLVTAERVHNLLEVSEYTSLRPGQESRVNDLIPVVTDILEGELGVIFVEPPGTEIKTVEYDGFGNLCLPIKVKTISAISLNPLWNGTTWTGGTLQVAGTWRLVNGNAQGGYREIEHLTDRWRGFYAITGQWVDSILLTAAPEDLVYAATYIVAEMYKNQPADPTGVTGPEGLVASARDIFRQPDVAKTLNRYRLMPLEPWRI